MAAVTKKSYRPLRTIWLAVFFLAQSVLPPHTSKPVLVQVQPRESVEGIS